MAVVLMDERVGLAAVGAVERGLAGLVGGVDPDDVALTDALGLWVAFDRIERLAMAAKTLLAVRVEVAGAWKGSGARSAAEHLARLSGSTVGVARRMLETSRLLGSLPVVVDALRVGELSAVQVEAIAAAGAVDPLAQARLVALAATTSVAELREECLRTQVAADPDLDATHRRIRALRRVRSFTDGEGAWNLVARGTADEGARFEAILEPLIDARFVAARAAGEREARAAYAFDALMELADRGGDGEPAGAESDGEPRAKRRRFTPRFLALLHVDVEALVRGAVEGEETCEIVGVGPVPVRVARDLLGDAIVKLVITKGVDVATVVHLGRAPTAAQRIALLWSKPKCANEACSSMFVQLDHREPWAATKRTRLGALDPLCPHDHHLKTNEGWSLVDGNGRRAFVGPDDPRHPRNKPPPDSG